ncbi:deoxyuridine 5'-triphosphate nucleotidohydrolase [bacterium Unc6]|nr:deoxyuridine 5'-triphosphate nucleotidohydrolase [bacterium Unc6]
MREVILRIKRKRGCEDIPVPKYMSEGASGFDLCADVEQKICIKPGEIKLISVGFYVSIPYGYEAQVRPRSGLVIKHGVTVANAPGTIDSDYRGLVNVILVNHGKEPYIVKRGQRIAQMIIQEVIQAQIQETDMLDITQRNEGGFGHTGT